MQKDHAPTPTGCPRCGWLGVSEQAAGNALCPSCGTQTNPLRQKGLDNLRSHYRALGKIGYSQQLTRDQRSAEQHRLEQFFERIGQAL